MEEHCVAWRPPTFLEQFQSKFQFLHLLEKVPMLICWSSLQRTAQIYFFHSFQQVQFNTSVGNMHKLVSRLSSTGCEYVRTFKSAET